MRANAQQVQLPPTDVWLTVRALSTPMVRDVLDAHIYVADGCSPRPTGLLNILQCQLGFSKTKRNTLLYACIIRQNLGFLPDLNILT